jgi:putative salt-induced outer membrane protein YdiY
MVTLVKLNPLLTRLVSICFIFGPGVAHADQLRLSNGDVISGELVSHEDGMIRFNSPILGVLELCENDASIMAEIPEEKRGKGRRDSSSSDSDTDENGISSIPGRQWRSKLDVGLNWQNGSKDKRDVSIRFESERQAGNSHYRIQSRYLLSETNGTKSADTRSAGLRWRRDFNERWFSQTHTVYSDDDVREIDLNLDQNVGLGYRLLAGDRAKANLGAGVTLQYRHAAGLDEGLAKFGEFFQDLVWRFHERFEFSQEASALFSPDERPVGIMSQIPGVVVPEDVANYRLAFESVLRGKLTETMSVNLRFEYAFDNAIANRDARADQRVTTSLGYVF